jgi:hypothetical protein
MILVMILLALMGNIKGQSKIDFGTEKTNTWAVINDGVMGGRSLGTVNYENNSMHFEGSISLENNGGFSSLKSPFSTFNLSAHKLVEIRYRSSEIPMAITMEVSRAWYETYYRYALPSTQGEWKTLEIPLNDFQGQSVGRKTGDKLGKNELEQIIRLGFINEGKGPGDFDFEVDYLSFE